MYYPGLEGEKVSSPFEEDILDRINELNNRLAISRVAGSNTLTGLASGPQGPTVGTETMIHTTSISTLDAASDTQTFDIQVTLNTSTGSTSETTVMTKLHNINATGITMAA